MKKEEFLEGLRFALGGRVSESLISENVNYYNEYIDSQVRTGRGEEEIIGQLGDPRLLARSIAEANKHAGESLEYGETEEHAHQSGETARSRSYGMPGWLFGIIMVLVILGVLGIVITMLSWMIPILIPLMLIGFVIRMVRGSSR